MDASLLSSAELSAWYDRTSIPLRPLNEFRNKSLRPAVRGGGEGARAEAGVRRRRGEGGIARMVCRRCEPS
jgi:hypothetical protein